MSHSTNGLKRDSENKKKTKDIKKGRQNAGALFSIYKMLKNALKAKISTTKAFNINLFPYLCGQHLAILKKKSQSVFHLTSGYNIGR